MPAHRPPALHVWQTGSTSLDDPAAPRFVTEEVHSMKQRNPEAEYHFLDDAAQRAWVVEHYPPDVVAAYDGLPLAVMRADLWRYMVVLKEGGLYLDSDVHLMVPFAEWDALDPAMGCEVVIAKEHDTHFCQWAIFSLRPEHPLLAHVVSTTVEHIKEGARQTLQWTELMRLDDPFHFVHEFSGPAAWTRGVLGYFGLDWDVSAQGVGTGADDFLRGDWADASDAWSAARIEANGIRGISISPVSSAAGGGDESAGKVCVFGEMMFREKLLGNKYQSIANTADIASGAGRKWGSWHDSKGELILKSRIRATFRSLDRDGDGKLSLDELQALKELLPQMARSLPSKNKQRYFDPNYYRGHREESDVYQRFNVKDDVADGIGDPVAFLLEADLDGDGALSMEELTARLDAPKRGGKQPRGPPRAKWGRPLAGAAGVAAVAALAAATSPARRRRGRLLISAPTHGGGALSAPAPAWSQFLRTLGVGKNHLKLV